jgi:hypothetical protein
MVNKYGHGGWWYESARHSLASRGYKTGSKLNPKRDFPPYVNIISREALNQTAPFKKEFYEKRADYKKAFAELKRQGWNIRLDKDESSLFASTWDAWRGRNYLQLQLTDNKKVKINKVKIVDKDVGERIKPIFRKKYPSLEEIEQKKKNSSKKKKKFIFFAKDTKKWQGLSDNLPDSEFDKRQLAKGQKIEMEHTKDKSVAKHIAKDHLTEFKGKPYYDYLDDMEKKLKRN